MATTFNLTVSCGRDREREAHRALDEAHSLIALIESELSEFLPDSPVSILNRAPVSESVSASGYLLEILALSEKIREETEGAFDCTFRSVGCDIPPDQRIVWDAQSRTVARKGEMVRVGFGAIGKGFALDKVALLLEQRGFQNYLLCAGGSSIVMSGYFSQGKPWNWGWSWSRDEQGDDLGVRFEHTEGCRVAIGVSGTHQKGLHIVDPRVGDRPNEFRSALVVQNSCAEADALSTAFFVSKRTPTNRAYSPLAWIDAAGRANWNGAFQRLWGSIGSAAIALLVFLAATPSFAEEDSAVDLSDLGADAFNPYVFDRKFGWIILPILTLGVILLHLQKRKIPKRQGSQNEKT